MVLQKKSGGFIGSTVLPNEDLNNINTWHEWELDRISGYNAGSNVYFRDASDYITSGATYDIIAGSTYTYAYYRDGEGYIISGTTLELGKTIDFTYYRDANHIVISGLKEVS